MTVDTQGNLQVRLPGATSSLSNPPSDGTGPGATSESAISTPITVTEQVPVAWQQMNGQEVEVDAHYIVDKDGTVSFGVGSYDPAQPLILDPDLTYSTYLGGPNWDEGHGIAVDGDGNTYITGSAENDFPTVDPIPPGYSGGQQVFVSKLDPTGTTLLYSTYLGGTDGVAFGLGIAVDASGNAYVAGPTLATDFPTVDGYQSTYQGGVDGFLTELEDDGSDIVFSTYLGGSGDDHPNAVAIDLSGNAYVTGATTSSDFPLTNEYEDTYGGGDHDVFVSKLDTTDSTLPYSTYLGGSADENAFGIAADGSGNAYVTGQTSSTDFPTANAYQSTNQGSYDALVAKIDTTSSGSSSLVYSTYLGGGNPLDCDGNDQGRAIAVDSAGNAYVTGMTGSLEFPTRNAVKRASDCLDGFAAKLDDTGSSLAYSTYLGGGGDDGGLGIAVDDSGNAFVTGFTSSDNFPLVNPYQATWAGIHDGFVIKLKAEGSVPAYSTYLGAADGDYPSGIALDESDNAYIVGTTSSEDFPVTDDAVQEFFAGSHDAFAVKMPDLSGPLTSGDDAFLYKRAWEGEECTPECDYRPRNANDGNGYSYWEAQAQSDSWRVDVGEPVSLVKIGFFQGGNYATTVDIVASEDVTCTTPDVCDMVDPVTVRSDVQVSVGWNEVQLPADTAYRMYQIVATDYVDEGSWQMYTIQGIVGEPLPEPPLVDVFIGKRAWDGDECFGGCAHMAMSAVDGNDVTYWRPRSDSWRIDLENETDLGTIRLYQDGNYATTVDIHASSDVSCNEWGVCEMVDEDTILEDITLESGWNVITLPADAAYRMYEIVATDYQGTGQRTVTSIQGFAQASPPMHTRSYYIKDADPAAARELGCKARERGETGVAILDFGGPQQWNYNPDPYPHWEDFGAKLIGLPTVLSTDEVSDIAYEFAIGYTFYTWDDDEETCVSPPGATEADMMIVLGISNTAYPDPQGKRI